MESNPKPVILFTNTDSVYKEIGCDCYDRIRDVRSFNWDCKVIAHPPCRQFSKLKAFSKVDLIEKELVYKTVEHIRRYGGVLEHPEGSSLWKDLQMFNDGYGITLSIDQNWFGFPARKRTWLYIVGVERKNIPAYPLCFELPLKMVQNMDKKDRSSTTMDLAYWLLEIYKLCHVSTRSL